MAKPIALVYVPADEFNVNGKFSRSLLLKSLTNLRNSYPDYYWIIAPDRNSNPKPTRVDLKVFLEKDFTEIQYEELLKLVNEKINDTNQTR